MKISSAAKINLGLDVLRRREDGYHELSMIMQSISLYDDLEMEKTEEPGIALTGDAPGLSLGEDNLIWRAAHMLMEEFSLQQGVRIHLTKRIPMAAGLAGGSTDAAAAFRGMNQLFSLGLSTEELMQRGLKLGADIPYCIMGGTALAEGIGEKLTALPPLPDCAILLAKPPVEVSTAYVYTHLRLGEITKHPDIAGQRTALAQRDLEGLAGKMGNLLETVAVPMHPVIEEIRTSMLRHGALGARMSGSGPTVFGIFDAAEKAEEALFHVKEEGSAAFCMTVRPVPGPRRK